MKKVLFLVGLFAGSQVFAAVHTETVEYKEGKTVLKGYLAYDDANQNKRPGVLVAPEWWGLNAYAKKRAEQLAGLGYVALAMDVYGDGLTTTDASEAGKLSGIYKGDRALMRRRADAALQTILKQKFVDSTRVAAIGYCFGGTVVLELARSGANLNGVASFHGGLDTPTPDDAKNIKGKVLVLHGGDDPWVTKDYVLGFQDEMRKAGVDWELNTYGNAVHGFSNPAAGNDNSKGMAYNEKADRRSWIALQNFFAEIFQEKK